MAAPPDINSARMIAAGIDKTGLLVATWAYSVTLGIVFMQFGAYLPYRKKDPPMIQAVVGFLLLNEIAWTALSFASLEEQLLRVKPGSLVSLSLPKTHMHMSNLNVITLCSVNLFLIWRYQRLTRRCWVSIPLAMTALSSFALYIYSNILGLVLVERVAAPVIDLTLVFEGMTDVLTFGRISTILEFSVVTTTYIVLLIELCSYIRQDLVTGKKILRRLILLTLEGGVVTVAMALGSMINAAYGHNTAAFSILTACAARAYYMSMLLNLNTRQSSGLVMMDPSLSHITSLGNTTRLPETHADSFEASKVQLSQPSTGEMPIRYP